MKKWVIPYIDHEISFWQEIAQKFGEHILSVYFPMPGRLVASGRSPQPSRFQDDFLRRAPLTKTVLVNPILLTRPVEACGPAILEALRRLRGDYGVEEVTVSSLDLARMVKKGIPGYRVAASTLMGVSTPAQVLALQDYVDALIPDTRTLRDLRALEKLRRAFRGDIRLIVNEACLPGCLSRVQHFYEMAYSESFPPSLCRQLLNAAPWLRLTGAWVLPQHLHFYDGVCDHLKLAGRVTLRDPVKYLGVLSAYIHRDALRPNEIGGGPASIIEPIEIPEVLFERILTCEKDCASCTVCRDFYSEAIRTIREEV